MIPQIIKITETSLGKLWSVGKLMAMYYPLLEEGVSGGFSLFFFSSATAFIISSILWSSVWLEAHREN